MTSTSEWIGYAAAALTTGSFLPQAVLTIKTGNTESLSLAMYSAFTLGVLCWLIYGLYLSDRAIIIANAVTLALSLSILIVKVRNTFKQKP